MREQLIVCPKCGHVFDVNAERVAALSPATRSVWEAVGRTYREGRIMFGPESLALKVGRSKSTVSYHLAVLVREGLVVRVPQNKYKQTRHLYMGVLPNGSTPN